MSIVETQGLAAGYGRKAVVSGIDLKAWQGQMVALLGPNGTGKTTLLATIAGLLAPLAGTVRVAGRLIGDYSRMELARKVAVVLTDRIEPERMTVFDLVAAGRYPYTDFLQRLTPADHQRIEAVIDLVGVSDLATQQYNQLSDGQKQKALLARALAQEPEVIILDEPTSFLDLRNRMELLTILARLTTEQGLTVLLSLHEVELALKCCKWAVLIREGRIIDSGLTEAVLTEANIQKLYGLGRFSYNERFGGLEMSNPGPPTCFVVGGGGCGTPVYRLLTKHGIGLASGVIHQNDLDYQIGRSMGIPLAVNAAFDPISEEAFNQARAELEQTKTVIDPGFPLGLTNERNRELLHDAVRSGLPVISLRERSAGTAFYGEHAARVIFCNNFVELLARLQ